MKLSFDHSGIIVTEKREGMHYIEDNKLWVSDAADSPDHIEYLYYEEDSPAPEVMRTRPHVAFATDSFEEAAAWCDEVVYGPAPAGPTQDIMYALKDEALIEFCVSK